MSRSGRIVQTVGQLPVRHWCQSQRLPDHKFKEGLRVLHSYKREVLKVGVLLLKKEPLKPASLQRGSEDKMVGNWIKAVLWARNALPHFIRNLHLALSYLFVLVMAR